MSEPLTAMMDRVPSHGFDVVSEVVDGEVLVYHPARTTALYLNSTAGVIWGLCDGQRSVRDIIKIVEESYPESGTALADDVLIALASLRRSGVLVIT